MSLTKKIAEMLLSSPDGTQVIFSLTHDEGLMIHVAVPEHKTRPVIVTAECLKYTDEPILNLFIEDALKPIVADRIKS